MSKPSRERQLQDTQASLNAAGERLEGAGIGPEQSAEIFRPPKFTAIPIDAGAPTKSAAGSPAMPPTSS